MVWLHNPRTPAMESVARRAAEIATIEASLPIAAAARRNRPWRQFSFGMGSLLVVGGVAAAGYRVHGWSWGDSLYMVVITIFTVGYGEVNPVTDPGLRTITMATIVLGYAATLLIVSGLAQLILDGELSQSLGVRRRVTEIRELHDHVIICGYGRMGQRLAAQIRDRRSVLILDHSQAAAAEAAAAGLVVLVGNGAEEEILIAAGIRRASALVATVPDDAACVFMTITARMLCPDLTILARGERMTSESKLRQVGANHVILPAAIGADRLTELLLRPSAEAMIAAGDLPAGLVTDLRSIGMVVDELLVTPACPLVGRRLAELSIANRNSFLVMAVRGGDGRSRVNPGLDHAVAAGESIIVLGNRDDIATLCREYHLAGRGVPEVPNHPSR